MERDDADPRHLPPPGGTFDALAMGLSAIVLFAAVVFVWQKFHDMEPATLLMWAAMSFLTPAMLHGIGGPGLVVAGGLSIGIVVLAIPILLWRSAYRSSIVLSFALMLVGAALFGLALVPRSDAWPSVLRVFAGDSMGFVRSAALFDGIALASLGAATTLLTAAARRSARIGASYARPLRVLAALPTLLAACVIVVVGLVVSDAWKKRSSALRADTPIVNAATFGVPIDPRAMLHGHHHGSLPHGDTGLPVAPV